MQKRLLTMFLFGTAIASAQMAEEKMDAPKYDRWSIELSGGWNKPTRNFGQANSYYTSTPNFGQGSLGVRYMFNDKVGMRINGGFSHLSNDQNSDEFEAYYYRGTLEGVVNLTSVLDFQDWCDNVGLLFHSGVGYSLLDFKGAFDAAGNPVGVAADEDEMINFVFGLSPQLKLSNSIALFGDLSAIGSYKQTYTWDGTERLIGDKSRGLNGFMVNFSVGINFYLGGAEKHADWYSEENMLMEKVSELEERLSKVETDLIDTDMDGVADYLDREPNTMSGAIVDTKGVAVDMNKNGIPDSMESSLDNMYSKKGETNGGNGIGVKELLDNGYVNVYFQFNSDTPETYSLEAINYLIKYMQANPSAKAELIGYADEIGNEGYNSQLSEKRAKRVYDILVASGVNASRLSYKGNGEDASVDKSSSPARQLVRRVTFRLQ